VPGIIKTNIYHINILLTLPGVHLWEQNKNNMKKLVPFIKYVPFIGLIVFNYWMCIQCMYEIHANIAYVLIGIGLFSAIYLTYVAITNLITDIKNF